MVDLRFVVKIEDPLRDGTRRRTGGTAITTEDGSGDSAKFVSLKQNKRSVALDLRSEGGRAISRRSLTSADVVTKLVQRNLPW